MKKLISTLLVLSGIMLSFNGFAQAFTISGKWERAEKSPRLMLFEVVNGSMKFADTARIQSDRSFTFNYTPTKEGFFVVGTGQTTIKMGSYTFYMKPGDALNLVVNDSTYTLVGENTKENLAMEDWNRLVYPLERHWVYPEGVTFVEFFPLVEDVAAKTNAYSPVPTGNTLFDADFAKYRKFDVMNDALMFLQKPAKVHPKVEDFTNYYKSLKTKDVLANSDMLVYPYSMLFVKFVLTYENKINGKEGAVTEDDLIELAADDVKCDLVVAQVLSKINEEWRLEAFEAKYGKYFVTEAQKQRYESEKERIARRTKAQRIGEPGLAFTYKDVNGNDVSFSDFKGKVVYLDVWATWCGYCRREFPDLKKTEEHFAGNENIVFLGVSIDVPKDVQKWKDMIVAQKLPGVQVHCGDGADGIRKLYGIGGIPRFLLFDKEGNIFSANAPRPSSADLIPLLEKLLK